MKVLLYSNNKIDPNYDFTKQIALYLQNNNEEVVILKEMESFFTDINFITFEPERYISLILQACSLAVNPNKRIESLSEVLRSTCFKVSQLLFNGDIPMINEIRSVNSFLGTIKNGMEIGIVSNLAEELWAKALNIRNNAERNRLEVRRIKKEGSQGASLNIARGIKTLLEQNNDLRDNENLKNLVNRIGYGLENLGVTRENNPLGLYMTEVAPENAIGLNE